MINPKPGDTYVISEKHVISVYDVIFDIVEFKEFKDGTRSCGAYQLKEFRKRVGRLKRKERYFDTMPLPWSSGVYFGHSHKKAISYIRATYRRDKRDFNHYTKASWRP